ncbi:MAG: hypothetical protein AVDCRST_MAG89-4462, partial [uncultured Gemmatimonadetes bacterium]
CAWGFAAQPPGWRGPAIPFAPGAGTKGSGEFARVEYVVAFAKL